MAWNSDVQWIDIQLDEAQKKKMRTWFDTECEKFDVMHALTGLNYKITISWDARNQCFACFLIPLGEKHPNAGCILTSRSNDWVKAVYSAYYRSEILKKGHWWVGPREKGAPDEWDI